MSNDTQPFLTPEEVTAICEQAVIIAREAGVLYTALGVTLIDMAQNNGSLTTAGRRFHTVQQTRLCLGHGFSHGEWAEVAAKNPRCDYETDFAIPAEDTMPSVYARGTRYAHVYPDYLEAALYLPTLAQQDGPAGEAAR